jgi:hypothetical protein
MKKFIFILFLIVPAMRAYPQDSIAISPSSSKFSLGAGIGLDYGGYGFRLSASPSESVVIFGDLGYNLLEIGYGAGLDFRLIPKSNVCPYFGVLYGYNAVIKIENANNLSQSYFGPSLNFGVEFRSKRKPNYLNLELVVPFRSRQFHDDYNELKNNYGVVFKNSLYPVAFSIGYHFGF